MILKASDYKYPTSKERKVANKNYPKLQNFGFDSMYEIISIFGINPVEKVKRESDLSQWDICLSNKIGKLYETYILLVTNYNRGIPESFDEMKEKEILNRFFFNYYIEIFYYYFFSVRDNISQILNVYYNLNIDENIIYFEKILFLIPNRNVKNSLTDFGKLTKKTNEIRNAFTHRFPANYPDYRPILSKKEGEKPFSSGRGDYTKPSEFMNNINESLCILYNFISELKKEIKPDI
ncbi:MAG: Cthe_2314 family HEPN domain-containing protein [Bacteroidales bacterium]|nr:Cthe_2314 family HEPN domain-containing protein [Bacteroidales bacterium]